jgi:hypothetical protein
MNAPKKPSNLKMALVLAGIAAFFFAAVILQHFWH